MDISEFRTLMNKIDSISIRLAIFVPAILIAWVIISAIRADGKATHCYLEKDSTQSIDESPSAIYSLIMYRPWRDSIKVFSSKDYNKVKLKALELECPLK